MVAQSSANFPIFRGHARQCGRGFGALAKTLGRTAIPFIKKYIVPAAKRIGADLFEIAAPEIGEVVSGRKKLKTFAKDVGKKKFENSWEAEKRNLSVEQEEPFPKRVVQKSVALAKTFLTI